MCWTSKKVVKKRLKPALFLHIQKTAGTSMIEIARQYYNESLISHGDFAGHRPEEFSSTMFVSGHFGYRFAEYFISSRYSFTFLRDPAERLLSFYYFCKTRDPDEFSIYRKAQELDLEHFLLAGLEDGVVKRHIWNSQAWRLASGPKLSHDDQIKWHHPDELLRLACAHLDQFSHVGFTETFEYDRNIILDALGLDLPQGEVRVNVTTDRATKSNLSPVESMLIEELTELDQCLYDYAWSHRRLSST